ncbi:MAG: T9SS type A sorting domain-containing protein, partial [Chitinophagales bacterium]|nr:T9SS type A sorting domain-containing protein [Chitinophagales bacterium]
DNCGNISLAIDEFEFDCSEIGPNTVILTVTDDQGLTDTCSAIVNIMDLTKPTALCNSTVTAYADKNGDVQITAALIDNGSSDNCDIVSYTFDLNTLHCTSNLVTMTVTDQSGNSASCATTVNVIDTLGPQAMCNDINLPLQPSGIEIITLADVNAGSWDGCGIQTMSLSQTIFSCSDQGTNIETLTVTDINGNTSVCEFKVFVTDPFGKCTPPCTSPQNPVTTNITVSSATLSWDPVANATNYILKGNKLGGPQVAISVSGTSYTADPLTKQTTYVWDVAAVCIGNLVSQPSEQDTFTTKACGVPMNLNVTNITATSATLNWDVEDDAVGYKLTGRPIGGGKVTKLIVGGGTNSFQANGLNPGTSYIWTLNSICDQSPLISSAKAPIDTFTTLFEITFSVDMSCMDPVYAFTNVYISGPAVGWCATCLPLVDQGGNIWSNTFQFPAGTFEYKYIVDGFASQENLIDDMQGGASCAPITDYFSYANRTVEIGTVPGVNETYGSCSPCPVGIPGCTDTSALNYDSTATLDDGSCIYNVTFNVDMTCETGFSTVSIAGPFCSWCASGFELSDPDSNGIYSGTFAMSSPLEFKYMVDGFASQEDLVDDMQGGATCAPVTNYSSYANRLITFSGHDTTDDVYGTCGNLPCVTAPTKLAADHLSLGASVYPNPNSGLFNLEVDNLKEDAVVEVFDLLGKRIYVEEVSHTGTTINIEMDLRSEEKGTYFIKITSGEEQMVRRVVVN